MQVLEIFGALKPDLQKTPVVAEVLRLGRMMVGMMVGTMVRAMVRSTVGAMLGIMIGGTARTIVGMMVGTRVRTMGRGRHGDATSISSYRTSGRPTFPDKTEWAADRWSGRYSRQVVRARSPLLPRSFFARDSVVVARDLIGQLLVREHDAGRVVLRITETEAYCGPPDTASHARHGMTTRNAPIWGPAGHVYVYLCYGIHTLLNLVAGGRGEGIAVLIRSAEVVEGLQLVLDRRRATASPALLAGPGKVAQALALDVHFNHHDVCAAGGLEAREGACSEVVVGPRIGVDYANERDRRAPLRFGLAGSAAVTKRAELATPPLNPRSFAGARRTSRTRRPSP